MGRAKTHCPSCNSLQRFTPKVKLLRLQNVYERYAECKVCKHVVIISRHTPDEYSELQKGQRRANRLRRVASRRGARAR